MFTLCLCTLRIVEVCWWGINVLVVGIRTDEIPKTLVEDVGVLLSEKEVLYLLSMLPFSLLCSSQCLVFGSPSLWFLLLNTSNKACLLHEKYEFVCITKYYKGKGSTFWTYPKSGGHQRCCAGDIVIICEVELKDLTGMLFCRSTWGYF